MADNRPCLALVQATHCTTVPARESHDKTYGTPAHEEDRALHEVPTSLQRSDGHLRLPGGPAVAAKIDRPHEQSPAGMAELAEQVEALFSARSAAAGNAVVRSIRGRTADPAGVQKRR